MDAVLTDELYIRFRDLLRERSGLDYPERKRADLTHCLLLSLNTSGLTSLDELYTAAVAGGTVWEQVLAHATIGETYFFRNAAQFEALRQHILPELLTRRASARTLRFWSAGCATGEEPYSLAMLLADVLPRNVDWQASILATDINPHFLARAREGTYGSWSFRETPPAMKSRFFSEQQGRWQLSPDIRRMVTFMRLNLAEASYPAVVNGTCALDLIICRNVTIYFDDSMTRQVIGRFYNALTPGGWLVVGHAEPQASSDSRFEIHNYPDTVVYRKPLNAPMFAFDPIQGTFSAGETPVLTPARTYTQPLSRFHDEPARAVGGGTPPAPRSEPVPAQPKRPVTPASALSNNWSAIAARLTAGDSVGAEPLLNSLLRDEPDHVPALVALGRIRANSGDWQAAETHCAHALTRDPLFVGAHYLSAQVHEHQGRLDDALAAYRRCAFLDANFVLGTLGMAGIWRQMGLLPDARRAYRSAQRQFANLPPDTRFVEADGANAADLLALVTQQLVALG